MKLSLASVYQNEVWKLPPLGKDSGVTPVDNFPQAGDSDKVIAAKKQSRAQAHEQMRSSAGRSKPTEAAPVPQQPTVVRTGKDASGRKVEQMSDGSIRYAK